VLSERDKIEKGRTAAYPPRDPKNCPNAGFFLSRLAGKHMIGNGYGKITGAIAAFPNASRP